MSSLRRHALLAVLLIALLAIVAATGCAKDTKTDDKGTEAKAPVKIGVIVSLTGTYAGLGDPEKKAIELEVKKINDAGGANGHKIDVVFADDGTDEAKAVAAAAKLIDQDKVAMIIGGTGTGQSMAVRGDVDKAGIPQISMAGGTVITATFDPLVFQTAWSNKLVIPYELAYLKARGIAKIGLISDSGGFGKDGKAVFESLVANYGISIVSNQTFNPGDTDMSAQLTKIKTSDAQAIVMVTAGKEAAMIANNIKSLGITLPFYGTHGNARKEFIDGAGAAAEGFRFAAGKVLIPSLYGEGTEEYAVATDFVDRFNGAYGAKPSTFAGHAYDAIHIAADAIGRVDGDITAAKLRDAIEGTSGLVGIGGTFTFSATDHNGLSESDLVFYEIKDGAWIEAPK